MKENFNSYFFVLVKTNGTACVFDGLYYKEECKSSTDSSPMKCIISDLILNYLELSVNRVKFGRSALFKLK